MKDTELSKMINMPISTMQDCKKRDPENWRSIVYRLLSSMTVEQLEARMNVLGIKKK